MLHNFLCIARRSFDCARLFDRSISGSYREHYICTRVARLINYHYEKVCWHFASSAFVTPLHTARCIQVHGRLRVSKKLHGGGRAAADKQCKFDVALQRCQEIDNNLRVNILAIHATTYLYESACDANTPLTKTLTAQTLRWSLTPPSR